MYTRDIVFKSITDVFVTVTEKNETAVFPPNREASYSSISQDWDQWRYFHNLFWKRERFKEIDMSAWKLYGIEIKEQIPLSTIDK